MTVTFCGHSQITEKEKVKRWLEDTVTLLIAEGADTFYLGGYGDFDLLSASVLRKLQKSHPQIKLILVLPYLNRKFDFSEYDSTLYPALEKVPPKFAILKRNQKMVELSDVIVAYVTHSWGGAAKTLAYAGRKKKFVLCFPAYKENLEEMEQL